MYIQLVVLNYIRSHTIYKLHSQSTNTLSRNAYRDLIKIDQSLITYVHQLVVFYYTRSNTIYKVHFFSIKKTLSTNAYRDLIKIDRSQITWELDLCLSCDWWCEGEWWADPLDDPAEEIEHIELFRDPNEDGDEGGVWKVKLPSPLFVSLITWKVKWKIQR